MTYASYQPPVHVLDEAKILGQQHIPKSIKTNGGFARALVLQARYDATITSFSPYTGNPDIDTILTELKERRGYLNAAIDHYLRRERDGNLRRMEKEQYDPRRK